MLINIPYYLASCLLGAGVFLCISSKSYFSRLIGLSIIQSGVIIFMLTIGKVFNAPPPIIRDGYTVYSNIVPQTLMLTAIVVGIATFSIATILLIKIKRNFGTIDADILDENKVTRFVDESS